MITQIASRTLLTAEDIPELLREIPMPPKKLWIEGILPVPEAVSPFDNKCRFLCVVGSRRHSAYAREACEHLIAGLAGYNICIVSGLALGIDSIAHEAALKAGLTTIAFPGSGLDRSVLYPPSHLGLAERILEAGGALLSEFDLTMPAQPWMFPQRNRLMAGISHATLIIEAAAQSGTLITAMYTTEYNRDMLALPGHILSPLSYGPNKLIRTGAIPITSSEDILEALSILPKTTSTANGTSFVINRELSDLEQQIIDIISVEPVSREILIQKTETEPSQLNVTLSLLELDNVIVERYGRIMIRR